MNKKKKRKKKIVFILLFIFLILESLINDETFYHVEIKNLHNVYLYFSFAR